MTKYENLMDPQVQSCPYSLYKRLRLKDPVYHMPETGFYLITSFEHCNEVIRQPDLFSVVLAQWRSSLKGCQKRL